MWHIINHIAFELTYIKHELCATKTCKHHTCHTYVDIWYDWERSHLNHIRHACLGAQLWNVQTNSLMPFWTSNWTILIIEITLLNT